MGGRVPKNGWYKHDCLTFNFLILNDDFGWDGFDVCFCVGWWCNSRPPPKKNRSWLLTTIPSLSILLHAQIRLTLQSDFGHPNLFCSPFQMQDIQVPEIWHSAPESSLICWISFITSGVFVVFIPMDCWWMFHLPQFHQQDFFHQHQLPSNFPQMAPVQLPSNGTCGYPSTKKNKSTLAVSSPNIPPYKPSKKWVTLNFVVQL